MAGTHFTLHGRVTTIILFLSFFFGWSRWPNMTFAVKPGYFYVYFRLTALKNKGIICQIVKINNSQLSSRPGELLGAETGTVNGPG